MKKIPNEIRNTSVEKNIKNAKSSNSTTRSNYKIKKVINDCEKMNEEESEKSVKSLRFPFNTIQIGRKFKRNNFKLNIFSSMKSKSSNKDVSCKPESVLQVNRNEEKLLQRKNELMYKTI